MSFSPTNTNLQRLSRKIAESGKDFVVILGAGVSRPAGFPDWAGLREYLLSCLEQHYQEMGTPNFESSLARIRNNKDPWDAFEELKQELGKNEYTKLITDRLDTSKKTPPLLFSELWKLNIAGIITFNLDKFALDSYSQCFGKSVDYATWQEPHKYQNFLSKPDGFVFYAHGILNDPTSWVMTRRERNHTYHNDPFKKMMGTVLNGKNLIIAGFNPGEWSFLQLLNDISISQGALGGDNFCIIPKQPDDYYKYDEAGISLIPYEPADPVMHPEVFDIFKWLGQNKKSEDTVYGFASSDEKPFDEKDLLALLAKGGYSLDELRQTLNGIIAGIVPSDRTPTQNEMTALIDFYLKYSRQLHDAWYINPNANDGGNYLWGYRLEKAIGKGSFGRVLEAYDAQGGKYAVKVLLEEVRDNKDYINCFRRGTRAMQIMKSHKVDGMVEIKSAYEVPACIVMDFIEGFTLREAIDKHCFTTMQQRLLVIQEVAKIIHEAHQLPESVLHRDIKPENIILENCYSSDFGDELKVKVLDFDLAWHRGATENTVMPTGSQGFMAPEQMIAGKHEKTRSKAVDVYSLGMLLYYILLDENPYPNAHAFKDFRERMIDSMTNKFKFSWSVSPLYLADTVVLATKHEQDDRIPLSTFLERIHIVHSMEIEDSLPNSHALLLLELAQLIDPLALVNVLDGLGCHIKSENLSICKTIDMYSSSDGGIITLHVTVCTTKNSADNKNRNVKYIKPALEKAIAQVDHNLFCSSHYDPFLDAGTMSITLLCELPVKISREWIRRLARNISAIRAEMRFT